jgi:hypothetical protein
MDQIVLLIVLCFQSSLVFAEMSQGHWHAGIGDPTIFGWLTVFVYLVAVVRCIVRTQDSKKYGGNYQFWVYLAIFLLLLGINKQLDLQSWFTQTMKENAIAHGWYARRHIMQMAFIAAVGLGMLTILLSLRLFVANSWRHFKLTWLGIVLLCTFILIRAASFHHLDIFINHHVLGLRVNVILEIGAILLIILGTYINKKSPNTITAVTSTMPDYVVIDHPGDDVRCPSCGVQPLSKTVDGRVFKCRACGYRYTVSVINR